MPVPVVLLDANILFPAPLRQLLLCCANTAVFRPRWTDDINSEWIRALHRKSRHISIDTLDDVRRLMDQAFPRARVTGHAPLVPTLRLPDPDDRHVLAAAITAGAQTIFTHNLKDFPAKSLKPHGLWAQDPDVFLVRRLDSAPDPLLEAVRLHRLQQPYRGTSWEAYLQLLRMQRLVRVAKRLSRIGDITQ